MKQRVITALCILVVAVPLLWFSDLVIWPVALAALALLGEWEMLRVLGRQKDLPLAIPSYLMAAALPLGTELVRVGTLAARDCVLYAFAATVLYLFYLFAVVVFRRGREQIAGPVTLFAMTFYVSFAFASLGLIRYLPGGGFLMPFAFIGAWVCDVFALLTGKLCGKTKLIPEVSPHKTVEGSVGGVIFAVLACELYAILIGVFTDLTPRYLAIGVLGLLLSLVSQIGDLIFSWIKREHGVKDYSRIFPGHGGVLDRFDSVLATALLTLLFTLSVSLFR